MILATSLAIASGIAIYVAKKEVERAIENKNIDLYVHNCDKAIKKIPNQEFCAKGTRSGSPCRMMVDILT